VPADELWRVRELYNVAYVDEPYCDERLAFSQRRLLNCNDPWSANLGGAE
jgi:hypothetical protein